jgi:hypothetical protein
MAWPFCQAVSIIVTLIFFRCTPDPFEVKEKKEGEKDIKKEK